MPLIEIRNLKKDYVNEDLVTPVLRGITFSIEKGEFVSIMGPSGSGKSTLMHIMSGLDHPTTGRVLIDNQDIHQLKTKALDNFRATEMSFIFQAFFVEANQTCYQNVALPLEIAGVSASRRKKLVMDAMALVDISEKLNTKAGNLSGGQKQRLAIARAVVNKPKLIFADEPTGNLDPLSTHDIIQIFKKINDIGTTVILTTHNKGVIDDLGKRVITMENGKIIRDSKHGK